MADVRKLKDRAAEQMGKRRFDKAAETYAELCAIEPADLTLRQRLGDAQRLAGRTREAVHTYQSVADRFAHEGLLLKAIAVNKVILELDPLHTATQATLATLYAQRQGRAAAKEAEAPLKPVEARPTAAAVSLELPDATEEMELERPETKGDDSRALTPLDDLEEAANAAAAQLEDDAEETDVSDIAIEEAPDRASPADFARASADAPTPELSLDLEAEMDRQIAAGPAANVPTQLPQTPIFSDLEPSAFVDLLQRCKLARFEAGDAIIRQGEPGRSFFVVSSGAVKVRRKETSGEVLELARLQEGAFFGEMALLSDGPRTASVFAEGAVELLEFPAEVLTRLIAKHASARQAVEKFTRSRLLGSVMASSALFRPFNAENRRSLIERFMVRDVAKGEAVLEQDKPGDGLYVVMQGRFEVRRREPGSSNALLLSELHEGDVFGEISLLTRSAATADVVSVEGGRVLRLPRQVFDEVILTHPQILELVAQLSDQRMQSIEAVLASQSGTEADGLMLL